MLVYFFICPFSKSEALFTVRPVNMSSAGEARTCAHIPGDFSVIDNCLCASMFHSAGNISIFLFVEDKEVRFK